MTHTTIIKTITLYKIAYPNAYKDFTSKEMEAICNLWYEEFKDCDEKVFEGAVKRLIGTLDYPPSIAAVKREVNKITQPDLSLNAHDEWNKVLKALHRWGMNREEKIFEELGKYTGEILKLIGVRRIAMATQEELPFIQKDFIGEFEANKKKLNDLSSYSVLTQSERKIMGRKEVKKIED